MFGVLSPTLLSLSLSPPYLCISDLSLTPIVSLSSLSPSSLSPLSLSFFSLLSLLSLSLMPLFLFLSLSLSLSLSLAHSRFPLCRSHAHFFPP